MSKRLERVCIFSVSTGATENVLSKRVRFGARILAR